MINHLSLLLIYFVCGQSFVDARRYKPNWKDLDTRPLPEWYDRAKVGIFLHWGVYSVPGYHDEWFWKHLTDGKEDVKKFMEKVYPPGFKYEQFASSFTAELFDPNEWADLFKKAGAKYVVLTAKHHDGFTLFPSNLSLKWNAVDVGPRRDVIKDLSIAVRKKNLKFGLYYSLYEWYNPMYLKDKATEFSTHNFVSRKVIPDIIKLVKDYKPSVIWSDGDWEASDKYWKSTGILAWLYNDSPVKNEVVVNDRWGQGTKGKHGDYYNFDDRFSSGVLLKHKWESAFTVDKRSWGFRRTMTISDILTPEELIGNVVKAVSCGGNALINIGPTKKGKIPKIFQEKLLELGEWLNINGEAIYGTSPCSHQYDSTDSGVWYTCRKTKYYAMNPTAPPQKTDKVTAIYAIILKWPRNNKNTLIIKRMAYNLKRGYHKVEMLGERSGPLKWTIKNGLAYIVLPKKVLSKRAWTLKFTRTTEST